MGPKLDFVRQDVPNVRSLTSLSFICSAPPPLLCEKHPPAATLILTPLWPRRPLDRRVLPLQRGFPVLAPSFRAEIPLSPGTLDDVASLLHVPRYYAYFTDFYGIPRRLLSPSLATLALSAPRPSPFCSSSISITSVLYFFFRSRSVSPSLIPLLSASHSSLVDFL